MIQDVKERLEKFSESQKKNQPIMPVPIKKFHILTI
jgi:hypothetical protein